MVYRTSNSAVVRAAERRDWTLVEKLLRIPKILGTFPPELYPGHTAAENEKADSSKEIERKTKMASYNNGEALKLALLYGARWQTVLCIFTYMSELSLERLSAYNGGNTPLHFAVLCRKGPPSAKVIRLGLYTRSRANGRNRKGWCPAHTAALR
mmetsp:Transcript_23641/g.44152  ORF Transcript_23641/g.44152 Transcript_23641/m.44152 type:complete len:154 (-) Transcript_23641:621-1082(-)